VSVNQKLIFPSAPPVKHARNHAFGPVLLSLQKIPKLAPIHIQNPLTLFTRDIDSRNGNFRIVFVNKRIQIGPNGNKEVHRKTNQSQKTNPERHLPIFSHLCRTGCGNPGQNDDRTQNKNHKCLGNSKRNAWLFNKKRIKIQRITAPFGKQNNDHTQGKNSIDRSCGFSFK